MDYRRSAALLIAALILAAPLSPQASTTRLYTYYMLPGGTSWAWQSVVIDAPLQMSIDSAGQAHLGIAGRKYALSARWSGSAWVLPDIPRPGSLECSINGLAATPVSDYSISGSALTLTLQDLDPAATSVLCSYDR